MTPSARPKVTIGIPLHRSKEFIDVVAGNIDRVDRDDVEILMSDRTRLDDALEVLANRYRNDNRVVAIAADDGGGWVENFNGLLRRAQGEFFCWMAHDDDFPQGGLDALVGELEADEELLLAFGRLQPVELDGTPRPPEVDTWLVEPKHPWPPRWLARDAVRVLRWTGGIAVHGAFRRAPIVANDLFLPHTRGDIESDTAWVFGVGLLGPLRYVPDVVIRKRMPLDSLTRGWKWSALERLSAARARAGYALRYPATVGDKARALLGVARHAGHITLEGLRHRTRRVTGR